MQTSRRWPKVALRILAGMAVIVLLDVALSYALVPYGSVTECVWWAYRQASGEKIDTIVAGSSYALNDIYPEALDETLGSSSWNMATQAQSLNDTYQAIESAIDDHGITRAIVCSSYDTICTRPYYANEIAFAQQRSYGQGVGAYLRNYGAVAAQPEMSSLSRSVALAFPWAVNNVGFSPSAVIENLRLRASYDNPVDALLSHEQSWWYMGRGFGTNYWRIDPDAVGTISSEKLTSEEFRADNLDDVERIMRLCRDRGVTLYWVIGPRPAYEVLCHGDSYAPQMSQLQGLAERYGAVYLDYTMARPDYYAIGENELQDTEHLNLDGGRRFSNLLGETIAQIEAGESYEGRFFSYAEYDQFEQSVDRVAVVRLSTTVEKGTVMASASSYQGPFDVEYRFDVVFGDDDVWTTVRDYEAGPELRLAVDGHGVMRVRAYARRVGSSEEYERYHTRRVMY